MRVGFAGTPEFAAQALRALAASGFTVPLVLTQPDRPAGRGLKLQASAVKQVAQALSVPVCQPQGLRLDGRFATDAHEARAALEAAQLDVLVVAAYGLILPPWLLDLPRLGCLNIHASRLPRWRGAAPIHRAIEAGDTETGVTIMQMDAGLDTGPVLLMESLAISDEDTTATLHDRLATLGARLIVEALELAACGGLVATAQPDAGVTYAAKIDKAEAALDWALPARRLDCRIRAFDPAPGCSTRWGDTVIKVWRARPHGDGVVAAPGTVLAVRDDAVRVACGDGALDLLELQRPGGRRQAAGPVAQALGLRQGDRLERVGAP